MADELTTTNKGKGVQQLVEALRPKMASILPRHLTAERMARVVLVEASRNPKLYECTPATLATCIMTVAQIGLEPSSPLGHAYLIPRWNSKANATECTLLLGYKGLCELARRSGEVARITAEVVYRDEMDRGLWRASVEPPEVEHRWAPDVNRDEENIVAAYARAVLKDGSVAQVVLTVADIEKRKGRSQARGNGPWVTDYAAMARKSALRALLSGGLVPLSSELATALDVDADKPEPAVVVDLVSETPARPVSNRDSKRRTIIEEVVGTEEPEQEPAPEPEPSLAEMRANEEKRAADAKERYALKKDIDIMEKEMNDDGERVALRRKHGLYDGPISGARASDETLKAYHRELDLIISARREEA